MRKFFSLIATLFTVFFSMSSCGKKCELSYRYYGMTIDICIDTDGTYQVSYGGRTYTYHEPEGFEEEELVKYCDEYNGDLSSGRCD